MSSQRSLFPQTLELSAQDAALMSDLLPDLEVLGYLIEPAGNQGFLINGTPADLEAGNEKVVIEQLLEQFKHFSGDLKFSKREKLIRSLSWQQSHQTWHCINRKRNENTGVRSLPMQATQCNSRWKPNLHRVQKDYLEQLFKR